MPAAIVGRDTELASVRDFLASVSDGAAALVLEGEAGAGKTTLWRAAVAESDASGLRVLKASPAESESSMSFSGIGDLLDPVLDEALAELPSPQRHVLSRALMLEEDEGPIPDVHAIGVAVLNAFRALAEKAPLVVAVDDVQWLDPASAGALAYSARRLGDERVGLLLARRVPLESSVLSELRRSLPADRLTMIDVGELDVGALHHVVQDTLGVALPRPLIAEIHEASAGNPFFALEIVRSLQRTGVAPEAGQPLPVPESLHELVHGRLLALTAASREYLLAAAAHAQPTTKVVEAAAGVDRSEGLAPAVNAGIVELDGERIRFTHPLLAAGAYEIADPARRLEIHARLAELLEDPEARAWQLAAAVDSPEESVAELLEEVAGQARARGAPRTSALLLDRARDLTPAHQREHAIRRAVDAAFLHFESGDSRRAETQLRAVIAPLSAGRERARALVVLARVLLAEAPQEALKLFAQVVDETENDPATLAVAHEGIASFSSWTFERFQEALRHTEVALTLAEELRDEALAGDVLVSQLTAETMLGRPTAAATAERALALQSSTVDRRVMDQPLVSVAEYWTWTDSHGRGRVALLDLLQRAHDIGDENSRPWLLFMLAEAERRLGNLVTALDHVRDGQGAAEQSGQPLFAGLNLAFEGQIQAELGRDEEARDAVSRALEIAPQRFVDLVASSALGHLELALGSPERTLSTLAQSVAFIRKEGIVEPGATRFVVDYVEALIELRRRDEAVELLDWYEQNAARLERVSALASSARCRGLLALQAGELDAAHVSFREALDFHAEVELPLDRGRTLLALGVAQRRAKHRSEARDTLGEALSIFERIGAELWATQARAELRRISGRAASPGSLTPAEERVAALVAEGKTNREVGAALFLSDRTVEGHLSRIFGKLGVRSRTELARVLTGSDQGIGPSNTGDSTVSPASSRP